MSSNMNKPQYKSYCWVVGSTSFREQQLSYKNEVLIRYLFKLFKDNPNKTWRELQETYYDSLKAGGYISGDAQIKDKDARQKTTGLAQVGLCYVNTRKVTPVGDKLVEIIDKGEFSSDNVFGIEKDSYIYLLQFLKYQIYDETFAVKPFVAFLYMVLKLGYLSKDEFTYLLPLCKDVKSIVAITSDLLNHRKTTSIDDFLLKNMMSMENYLKALEIFISKPGFPKDLVMEVGMHRKSRDYDQPFSLFFEKLYALASGKNTLTTSQKIAALNELRTISLDINSNQRSWWTQMFRLQNSKVFCVDDLDYFFSLDLCSFTDENEFKTKLFKQWHLFKWKSTLEDYYDLNKRYFSLTDIVKFDNQQFTITEMSKLYFEDVIDKTLFDPLVSKEEYDSNFTSLIPIEKISPWYSKTNADMLAAINARYGKSLSMTQLELYLKEIEHKTFMAFIDRRFPKATLESLLDDFRNRDDEKIKQKVTDTADPSTCFEYIIGIIWYNLSGRNGFLKDFLKLSLDSNYLPKTHAIGGNADIIFNYEPSRTYQKHDLLLEVTLSESTGQRHMEYEPVFRHLENHILRNSHREKDYVVFVAGKLDARTIQSFRSHKYYGYNDSGIERMGLKIIPLDCALLKTILATNRNYTDLYNIFDIAYNSDDMSTEWHNKYIVCKINNCN